MRRREIVVAAWGERLFFRGLLAVLLVGSGWELSRHLGSPRPGDLPFAVGVAGLCWFAFRAGFRARVVFSADGLCVTNIVRVVRIPLSAVVAITLDWLGIRIDTGGGRVRVWGVPDSFLDARGGRGADLAVQHLGGLVERFGGPAGQAPPDRAGHRRRGPAVWRAVPSAATCPPEVTRHGVFPDWWAFLGPLALLLSALLLRA